jgi:hypothetical protein
MNFYYLKLGKRNCEAEEWLSNRNKMGSPHAFIYFDNFKEKDYVKGKARKQALEFYRVGLDPNRAQTRFIVIFDGHLHLLQPLGPVKFLRSTLNNDKRPKPHRRKVMPVKIVEKRSILDLPLVLAGMASNQSLARGTFQMVMDNGNVFALTLLFEKSRHGRKPLLGLTATSLLECLSSTELETLTAKCFEELGCFVPAHLGGNLKGIDLIVKKEVPEPVYFCRQLLKRTNAIQVKRKTGNKKIDKDVNIYVALDAKEPNAVDAEMLLNQVKELPMTRAWLKRSLNWIPEKYLTDVGL